VAAAVMAGVARISGATYWYPYPVPSVPPVGLLALAPAVLVVLAAAFITGERPGAPA
jgi:hypothetical protein